MILAEIDLQLIFFLLMAVFGFISWLSGKLNPGEKQPPQQPPGPSRDAPRRRGAAESEEERMRRFLEALGMPADQPPVPQQPVRPQPAPRPVLTTPPPIPAQPRPVRRAVPPPPPRSLDELETTTLPVEQIALASLATQNVREFETVSSTVSATRAVSAYASEAVPQRGAALPELLRATLASPQQLRTAFVLREVLGPPLALRGE